MPRFVQFLVAMHLSCTNPMQPRLITLSRPLRLLEVLPIEARPKLDTADKHRAMTLDGAVFTWQDNRVPHLTMPIRRINYIAVQSYQAIRGSRQARTRFSSFLIPHQWTAAQLPNRCSEDSALRLLTRSVQELCRFTSTTLSTSNHPLAGTKG